MATRKSSKFNNHGHIQYKSNLKPWFGPLKKAAAALSKCSVSACAEQAYLEFLQEKYPEIYKQVSFVDFYMFEDRHYQRLPYDKMFCIAVTYLKPDPLIRQELFDKRERITDETGWYPLVMGEWANTRVLKWWLPRLKQDFQDQILETEIGDFHKIRSFNSMELGGTAFLLEGSMGSLLLDTGFGIQGMLPTDLKAVFISHFHGDHIGGVEACLDTKATIFMSELTLRSAMLRFSRNAKNAERFRANVLPIERIQFKLGDGSPFQVFPVFHAPGSIGYAFRDCRGHSVIYPGDLCLQNGFLDYSKEFLSNISRHAASKTWVLIDATMALRDQDFIDAADTPKNIIKEMLEELPKRNVVFVSRSIETLVYEYILAFLATRPFSEDKSIKLILNNRLLELCQSLLTPMITRRAEQLDLFINKVIGRSISNFIESHRVYPMTALPTVSPLENVVLFTTPDEANRNVELQKRIQGSLVVIAGTLATRPDDYPIEITKAKPRTILHVSSPDWNFHSHERDLAGVIRQLSKLGINSLLFHARRESLEKFIRNYSLNPKHVSIIDHRGVALN